MMKLNESKQSECKSTAFISNLVRQSSIYLSYGNIFSNISECCYHFIKPSIFSIYSLYTSIVSLQTTHLQQRLGDPAFHTTASNHHAQRQGSKAVRKNVKACGIPVHNSTYYESTEAARSHQINSAFTLRHFNLFP